ncbi:MAG: 50S ribosomal protein L6 [bacterium]
MSRIGKKPIHLPPGVEVAWSEGVVRVKGKLGSLERAIPEGITIRQVDSQVFVERADDSRRMKSLHGLWRTLINNMVIGVSQGFSKELEIAGVGYRVELRGKAIQLYLGFSHRVIFLPPPGIEFRIPSPNTIMVWGINKELVGEVAAKIRSIRKPEPYRGKGIKYVGETIRRKAGKSAGK